jgi:hypothetical protein
MSVLLPLLAEEKEEETPSPPPSSPVLCASNPATYSPGTDLIWPSPCSRFCFPSSLIEVH